MIWTPKPKKSKYEWHSRFAFLPTTLINGQVVWLRWIEYRIADSCMDTDFYEARLPLGKSELQK